jgi:hypothetical protein
LSDATICDCKPRNDLSSLNAASSVRRLAAPAVLIGVVVPTISEKLCFSTVVTILVRQNRNVSKAYRIDQYSNDDAYGPSFSLLKQGCEKNVQNFKML